MTEANRSKEPRVLLVPRGAGLTKEDRAALKEADILVIVMKDPKQARLLTSEPWPFDSNMLIKAALEALAGTGDYTKARAWSALIKAMQP